MMPPWVYFFLFTAIFYCLELGNIATIRKVHLAHVVGTLEDLCYVNSNGVVVSDLLLVSAEAIKAFMSIFGNYFYT